MQSTKKTESKYLKQPPEWEKNIRKAYIGWGINIQNIKKKNLSKFNIKKTKDNLKMSKRL